MGWCAIKVNSGQAVLAMVILMSSPLTWSLCLPVEIGQTLQIFCSCQNKKSGVYWEIKSSSGERVNVNGCDKESMLTLEGLHKLNLTYNASNSSIRLTHLTINDTNRQINCIQDSGASSTKVVLTECNVQVFYKPETPFCFTEITGRRSARFVCSTSKVYPGLECHFLYKSNKLITTIKPELIHYNLTAINRTGPTFLKGFCFAELSDLDPGDYQFFGVLRPNITQVYNSSVAARPSPIFVISGTSDDLPTTPTSVPTTPTTGSNQALPSGYVSIRKQGLVRSPVCHDSVINFTVFCEARGFRSQPKLTLLLNCTHEEHFQRRVLQSGENTSMINATFSADFQHKETVASCIVETPSGTISNQTELGVIWLQHILVEARFVSNNELIPKRITLKRNELFVFYCGVNGEQNRILISQFHVHCESDANITLLDQFHSESSFKVQLNIPRIKNTIRCTCTGIHKYGCSVQSSSFELKINETDSVSLANFKTLTYEMFVVIIVAAILTVLILGVVLQYFRYRRRSGQFCGCHSTSEPHIYEKVIDATCKTKCLNFFDSKCSDHTRASDVIAPSQGQGNNFHHTTAPLLSRSGSLAPADGAEDRRKQHVYAIKRSSPYENWFIT